MKRPILLLTLTLYAALAGCATHGPNDGRHAPATHHPNSIYSDPTYPGPGVHFGIGVGTWGAHRGAGAGFGIGF